MKVIRKMVKLMTKCKHKWVAMEDGTLDKFCVRCRKFAMQAQLTMPAMADMTAPLTHPMARETMEVPFYNGEHIRITVDKERFLEEMRREQGLDITHNIFQESFKNGG